MPDPREQPDARRRKRRPAPRRPRRREITVLCPNCEIRFRAAQREATYNTRCLSCERPVPVPGAHDAAEETSPSRKREQPKRKQVGDNVFRPLPKKKKKVQREGPEIPAFPFLSCVSFPWYPEVMWRWMTLSAGCAAVGFLFVTINWCFLMGGIMSRAGYAFCFPFAWLSIFTFSYIAASSTAIITETAYGNDRIGGWPEPDWRQWFFEMLLYLPALLSSISIGYGIAYLVSVAAGLVLASTVLEWLLFFATWGLAFYLLTPVFLLSVVDANSAFTIVTPFVISSMGRHWWGWLRFYGVAAGLAMLWPGLLIVGFAMAPFYSSLVTGPLMAAALLIYPRLLGRLALVCSQ